MECMIEFDYNELLSPGLCIDCKEFYSKLDRNLSKLKLSEEMQAICGLDIKTYVNNCELKIENQIKRLYDYGIRQIQFHFQDPNNPKDEECYLILNAYINNINYAKECFSKNNNKKLGNCSKGYFDEIKSTLKAILNSYHKQVMYNNSINPDASVLIGSLELLKICSCHIDTIQIYADKLIDDILLNIDDSTNFYVMQKINENPGNTYYQMLKQHKKFEETLARLWEEVVSRFSIDQVLDPQLGIKMVNIQNNSNELLENRSQLVNLYERFMSRYTMIVDEGISMLDKKVDHMKDIVNSALNVIADRTASFENKIIELMVNLFAYWTLSKVNDSDFSNPDNDDHIQKIESNDSPNSNAIGCSSCKASHVPVLVKPHAGQVVAIFRIFALDVPNNKIVNHVIEILTGEGKSVVLGISAAIFALLGLNVDCVCYSSYLSSRDKESFFNLFNAFGVDEFIVYGTLSELCEKTIENKAGGSIRSMTLQSFGIANNSTQKHVNSRPKALLIDEVDVFFNDDFYGNVYTSITKLVDPTITTIIEYIWSLKEDPKNFSLDIIIKSKQFIECKSRFSSYGKVIDESIKYMFYQLKELLNDIKNGKTPSPSHIPYVVGDSIAYKDQDSLSSQISLGYKTMWTYFIENSKKNSKISNTSKNSQICIRLDCGQFSIAEVPKLYIHVIGVSGTISSLVNDSILTESYGILKETRIPSVYGENKLKYLPIGPDANIKISQGLTHFIDISNEVETKSSNHSLSSKFKRPVLIFFESIIELNQYYQSDPAKKFKSRTKILTEQESVESKTNLIRHATSMNTITLLTREFGRGTDFIVFDEKVRKVGGPHVIQTFFSEDISEEIQIKGRSARQGGEGSYSMVLSIVQLEKFLIDQECMEHMIQTGDYGTFLDMKRDLYKKNIRGSMKVRVENFKPQHEMSLNFIDALLQKNPNKICEYLTKFNNCPDEYLIDCETRVLILMDATGSMTGCINNAKNAVGEMFTQIQDILTQFKVISNFEIQFAVYRNYNAPYDKILEWSNWTSDSKVLYEFINKIKPNYGLGREAVEMGLWHLNKTLSNSNEKTIDRVLLIGDQPPNTLEEVVKHRKNNHGEEYWLNKKIGLPFTYLDQLKEINKTNKNIVINSFYLNGNAAQSAFKAIAESTGGKSFSLDVSDVSVAAKFLCGHTVTNILEAINNNSKILQKGQLVSAYKQKYKGYVE